tara:strand:+ start:61 stop:555 length:495 start_codon:yes stop_codon:yes gene_type:complete
MGGVMKKEYTHIVVSNKRIKIVHVTTSEKWARNYLQLDADEPVSIYRLSRPIDALEAQQMQMKYLNNDDEFIKRFGKSIRLPILRVVSSKENLPLIEAQEFVGGWVERVRLANGDVLLIDEEGKLKFKEVNKEATAHYIASYGMTDVIRGDAILVTKGVNSKWK